MEGHAAVPQHEYLEGMGQVEGEVVKKHIAQTGAGEQPQDQIEIDIVDLRLGYALCGVLELMEHEKIGRAEAQDVHHAVPADGKRTYPEYFRGYMRIRYHR